jgi:hypothetical protein
MGVEGAQDLRTSLHWNEVKGLLMHRARHDVFHLKDI